MDRFAALECINQTNSPCVVSCHSGPLAKELFILCRPDSSEEDIDGQTVSIYRSLQSAVEREGGSLDQVLQETVFCRDIRGDLIPFQKTRSRIVTSQPGYASYAPASTAIGQPPVNGRHRIELLAYVLVPISGSISMPVLGGPRRKLSGRGFLLGGHRHAFLSNICGSPGNAEEESYRMFQAAAAVLKSEGLSFRDVVRTWIHLRHIIRDYQWMNRGRTRFFQEQRVELPPASTGIEGTPACESCAMCLSLLAVDHRAIDMHLISAPTMNEAWTYGSDFSRGIRVTGANGTTLFISGTASVNEEGETVHKGDPETQAERMILNISSLLVNQKASWRNVVSAITYFQDPADAPYFLEALNRKGIQGFPNALVRAAICRPDLLCEMEAIAVLPVSQC